MNSPKFFPDTSESYSGSGSRSSVANVARETASQVGSVASEAATRVKDSAAKMASDQKNSAADRVGAYGTAIHESAKSLEQQDPNIAWLTHRAADRLEGVASYMRTRDFQGLREDAENLARRHPVAFFGGLCVAGLVIGGVVRAACSSAAANRSMSSEDYAGSNDPDYSGRPSETDFEPTAAQGADAATAEI